MIWFNLGSFLTLFHIYLICLRILKLDKTSFHDPCELIKYIEPLIDPFEVGHTATVGDGMNMNTC